MIPWKKCMNEIPKVKNCFWLFFLLLFERVWMTTQRKEKTLLRDYIAVRIHDFESDICTTRKSYVRLVGNSKILIRINLLSFIRREWSFRVNKTNTSQTVGERDSVCQIRPDARLSTTWWRWPCHWSRRNADKLPRREKITSKFQLQ